MIRLIRSIGLGLFDFPHFMKEAGVTLSGAHSFYEGCGEGWFFILLCAAHNWVAHLGWENIVRPADGGGIVFSGVGVIQWFWPRTNDSCRLDLQM